MIFRSTQNPAIGVEDEWTIRVGINKLKLGITTVLVLLVLKDENHELK